MEYVQVIHPDGSKKKHPDRFPLLRASGDFFETGWRAAHGCTDPRHPVRSTGSVGTYHCTSVYNYIKKMRRLPVPWL